MAASQYTTGADTQGDLRKRHVANGHANGGYVPQDLDDKLKKKTVQKVSGDGDGDGHAKTSLWTTPRIVVSSIVHEHH